MCAPGMCSCSPLPLSELSVLFAGFILGCVFLILSLSWII